jgi:hypothetical protein
MAKETKSLQTVINTSDNTKKENLMVLGNIFGPTEIFIKVNSLRDQDKAKVS